MLKAYLKKNKGFKGKLQAYIGVYTKAPLAIYSIVMGKKVPFGVIKLKVGQIQAGTVRPHEKKFYYVDASGDSEMPLRIDLVPSYGNPDLEITIISDLYESKSNWHSLSSTPNYVSES